MDLNFKPNGYNSVSPYFIVDGAQILVELLIEIFDANGLRQYDLPDGKIMHVEVQIDDSVLMISDSSDKYPAIQQMVHIYVKDVEEVYKKAMNAGCVSIDEPSTRPGDPDKRGAFKDFGGNYWAVATQQ